MSIQVGGKDNGKRKGNGVHGEGGDMVYWGRVGEKKDRAKFVEARAEVQGMGNPYIGLQSPSPKPPHGINEQGIGRVGTGSSGRVRCVSSSGNGNPLVGTKVRVV